MAEVKVGMKVVLLAVESVDKLAVESVDKLAGTSVSTMVATKEMKKGNLMVDLMVAEMAVMMVAW